MPVLPDPGRSRAVLIGASTYSHLEDLPAVGNNLSGFFGVLVDPALGGLSADNCTVVAEPDMPVDVYRAVREHAAAAEDTLLVYFAGHGRTGARNELFLCLPGTDPDELPYTAWPYDELRRVVADSRATKRVVILDCCFSGRALADQAGDEETIFGQAGIEGTYILTATAANAVALAPPEAWYTAFTGTLLELLKTGIPEGPELLTFARIFPNLLHALNSRQLPQPRQQGTDTIAELALTRNPAYARRDRTAPLAPQVAPATQADNLAICCSGGGIRTAAYCLGALQSLGRAGLVAKARWILGVSGGGYVASSRALVARALPAGEKADAYAPGTPEDRNLRNDTHYIAPNVPTILAGVLSLLIGAIVTFVIVAAPLYAFTHAWGWLLRWQDVLVPSGPHAMKAAATGTAWWLPSVIAAGITLPLFAYWWLTLEPPGRRRNAWARWWAWLKPDGPDRSTNRAQIVSWAAALTAGLAAAMLAAPPLISWLTRSTGSFGTIARAIGFGAKPTWSFGALVGLIAAVAAIARSAQTGLARWNALNGQANGTAGQPGALGTLVGAVRQKLLPWLASAVIVLGAAVLALLWISDGAQAGYSPGQLLPVAVALAVALLARVVVNVNRLSMHEFYRWRLASAFAVTRRAAQAQDPVKARALFAQAVATPLSALREGEGEASGPGLVICGMANINAEREVRYGHGDCCVAFDPEHVTLRGYTSQVAQALTSDYEALVGRRRSTLFDVSAISGAAISPLMGSATRHAYQILFAAANICLGVWLPHPSLIRDARNWLDQPDSYSVGAWWEQHPLLLLGWYLMPHPFWHRNADRNDQRETRLWAHVLGLRLAGKGALWYRVMQPTLGLKWAEAAGRLSYRATWMYVTDGGHYDNLGLVEALRRGASNIMILDASGDKANTWFTLGGAIALARADAGVDIDVDPTAMIRGGRALTPGQVVRPWVHGRFRRPQPVDGLPQEGDIWVCKLGWWSGAPREVQDYARQHPTFPGDTTREQLYDAAEFEAYRQLGAAAALYAVEGERALVQAVELRY